MKNTNKKIFSFILSLLLCTTILLQKNPTAVQASTQTLSSYKKVSENKSQRIGNTTYFMKYNDKIKRYTVYAKRNSKNYILIRNCSSSSIVTNGNKLYYATGSTISYDFMPIMNQRHIIVYDIKQRKNKILKKMSGQGRGYGMLACNGKYLYFGTETQYADAKGSISVLNLQTQKVIQAGNTGSKIQKVKNKLLVSSTGFPHGGELYLINRDGSGHKQITTENVIEVKITNSYIYYTEAKYDWRIRKCKCDLSGNNVRLLTGWYR